MAFKNRSGNLLNASQIAITHSTVGATYVSDCNSAILPNVEYYTNMATENKPVGNISTFLVWAHQVSSNSVTQFATQKSTNSTLYMRQYNGVWGDWMVITKLLDAYPIGSIYESDNSTNPAHYFGGEWTQISSFDTCTLVGNTIVTPTSRMYAELFTLAQVRTMLHDAYGIDTEDIIYERVSVDVNSNEWNNGNVAALTTFYQPSDTTWYAYFSGTTSLNQQLTYEISYNREMYKFVRVA